jgi:hypothetical protein
METVRIRDPGWKKVGFGIRDGNIPDPPHWLLNDNSSLNFDYQDPDPEVRIRLWILWVCCIRIH